MSVLLNPPEPVLVRITCPRPPVRISAHLSTNLTWDYCPLPVIRLESSVSVHKSCRLRQSSVNGSTMWRHYFVYPLLSQLCVLCFGLFQDGNIGIGVFPQSEEIVVGSASLVELSCRHIASEAQMGHSADGTQDDATTVKNFLVLVCRTNVGRSTLARLRLSI